MATAERVLEIARAEIGVKESPANSNRVKYNTWYYREEVSGAAYPWCMAFVQWVFHEAGVPLPSRTASCGELMRAARKAGQWVIYEPFQPGDIVLYDFGGDAWPDHCGIVRVVNDRGCYCIEGNTSENGSQSNGGMVLDKWRPWGCYLGAVRPHYEEMKKMDNTPSPAHKDGVEWAVENGILQGNADGDLMLHQGLTREQFCTMLYRFAESIGKA